LSTIYFFLYKGISELEEDIQSLVAENKLIQEEIVYFTRWIVIAHLGFGKDVFSRDVLDAIVVNVFVSSLRSKRELRLSLADRMKIMRYVCDGNRDFSFRIKSSIGVLRYLELDGKLVL